MVDTDLLTPEWAEKIVKTLTPVYTDQDLFPDRVDDCNGYYYTDEVVEDLLFEKFQSILFNKYRKELMPFVTFSNGQKLNTDVKLTGPLITYQGMQLEDGEAVYTYYSEADMPYTGMGPLWDDYFLINGVSLCDKDDLLDFYLTDLSIFDVEDPSDLIANAENLADFEKSPKYHSAVAAIKGWWKQPYQEEMTFTMLKDRIEDLLDSATCEEESMQALYSVNVGYKPFLDFVNTKEGKKMYHENFGVCNLIMHMIRAAKWTQKYYWTPVGKTSGWTEHLFWNCVTMGTYYDSSLTDAHCNVRCKIGEWIADYLIIYLDKEYHFLPENVLEVINKP